MAESIVTYRGTIYPWHCDHMGHMNVMWYVGKFDEATWQLLASVGLSSTRLRQEGIGMVAVEQHIEYKRELVAGDLITIRVLRQYGDDLLQRDDLDVLFDAGVLPARKMTL